MPAPARPRRRLVRGVRGQPSGGEVGQLGAAGVDLDVAELVEEQAVQAAVAADRTGGAELHDGRRPNRGQFR